MSCTATIHTPEKRAVLSQMSPVMQQMVEFFSRRGQMASSPDGKDIQFNESSVSASSLLPTVDEGTPIMFTKTPKATVTRIGRFEITEYGSPTPGDANQARKDFVSPVKTRATEFPSSAAKLRPVLGDGNKNLLFLFSR